MVEGSPYSRWMDLWQVRTTAAQVISIPGFLLTAAVCPSRYGCALETAVIDRKQSPSGAAPGFPTLDDADFFPGPPLSYFLREVDEGWLVMAPAFGLESLLGENPHS
jgi:hypothetical protein